MTSLGGTKFVHFAKHKKYDSDLYANLVAPALNTAMQVETWLNGNGDLESKCDNKAQVNNLRSVKPGGVAFSSAKDHSKYAVSDDAKSPWVCIGDINRQVIASDYLIYSVVVAIQARRRHHVPDERACLVQLSHGE